jgi:hypothetical protein
MVVINEIIKKSIELLKEDIKEHPDKFYSEYDLQARLYYHLCNRLGKEYHHIHLEHNPHTGYDKENYNKKWIDCVREYGKNHIKISDFAKDVEENLAKRGKYDISIFNRIDSNSYEYYYAIELKKINSYSKSNYHKGFEDLYVLSDLIKKENKQIKKAETYFFVFAICSDNLNTAREYISKINQVYKKAKINFDYCIYDDKNNAVYCK